MELDGDLFDDGYVSVEECARRLGISTARVRTLVQQRVLKAYSDGYETMVQPALIRGGDDVTEWYTGADAAELTGHTIAEIDAAAATGVIDAAYFGWLLMVARKESGAGVNEVQLIQIQGGPNGGNWRLEFEGEWTVGIAYHPSAAQLQSALTALSTVGVGNAWVTKPGSWDYECEFQADLGSRDVPTMGWDDANLSGGTVLVTTVTEGAAAKRKRAAKRK